MKLMVTGGAGFIGSNFIKYILDKYPSYHVLNYDKLTYAGNLENLKQVENNEHYRFIKGDICDLKLVNELAKTVDVIVNIAAESHNDVSIQNPFAFIDSNTKGPFCLAQAAMEAKLERFIQISTDEVYGDFANGGKATEDSLLKPGSPYSAGKAGGDLQLLAAHRTYGFPCLITRCTNNLGPNQYPEKFLPLFITNALENKDLPLYHDGSEIRDWIDVRDHCSAIDLVLHKGKIGNVYNVGAENDPELTNLEVATKILDITDKPLSLIKYVKDRPGHDRRYAVDSSKIRALGWSPSIKFDDSLKQMVAWYQNNEVWWKKIKSGQYKEWYKKQYEI